MFPIPRVEICVGLRWFVGILQKNQFACKDLDFGAVEDNSVTCRKYWSVFLSTTDIVDHRVAKVSFLLLRYREAPGILGPYNA